MKKKEEVHGNKRVPKRSGNLPESMLKPLNGLPVCCVDLFACHVAYMW